MTKGPEGIMDYVAVLIVGFFVGLMFNTVVKIEKKQPGE